MNPMPFEKYRSFVPVDLPDRQWPSRRIDRAPLWCSVDLRDGNQALIDPMDGRRKMHMFQALVDMGFKEIEVGFPSASKTDFDFVRLLIEEDRIPRDVTIQVLTQARDELIRRTYESLVGCRRAVVHLYNSTSTLQRRVVFETDRAGIVEIAVNGARLVRELAQSAQGSEIVYQYSPESFTGTELDFAVDICEAVCDVWEPTLDRKAIINLPATVEMATPNIYADQIEWFIRRFRYRDRCIISLHPHNDRGTGVAAAELGVMAGADRVEGTLFGNGERTGNVDVVNLAMNLFTQGIDPELDISDIDRLKGVAEFCNQLPIHPRHPYAGELVYTAFSGSHQDAIKKGMQALDRSNSRQWEVPYLPLDPKDVGRDYEAIIRVNSQSGKGGVAYLMKADHGLDLPRGLQIEFSSMVQQAAEQSGSEIDSDEIRNLFEREYLLGEGPFSLVEHWSLPDPDAPGRRRLDAVIRRTGEELTIKGRGNGPIAAFVDALESGCGIKISVRDYNEHALGRGADATAVAYVEVADETGRALFGVGRDPNITIASLMAILGAVNRHLSRR